MIKPKVTVKHTGGKVRKRLTKLMEEAQGAYVTIGVHEDAGSYPGGSPKVAEVAYWNEFGTEEIPARSFLRSSVAENKAAIRKMRDYALKNYLEHGWSLEKALQSVGTVVQIMVQNKIKSNIGPANSGSWEPPKGYLGWKRLQGVANRTLIVTELLLRSITSQVFMPHKESGGEDGGKGGE